METDQDDWITRWERAEKVETCLRKALANERGRKLLSWFRKYKISPDGLAFCLTRLVWPMHKVVEEVKKRPWPKRVVSDKGAKQCRVAAQWLRKYGPVFNLANVETLRIQLEQYAKSLDRKYLVGTNRQEVNPDILDEWGPHDPARYQVIAFLRAYFVIAGPPDRLRYEKRRTWEVIKDVLIISGVVPPETTAQRVATIWSNQWRHVDRKAYAKKNAAIKRKDPKAMEMPADEKAA